MKNLRKEQKAAVIIIVTAFMIAAPFFSGKFTINISNSVPVGLWLRVDDKIKIGDVVEVNVDSFYSFDSMPEIYKQRRIKKFLKRTAGLHKDIINYAQYGLIEISGKIFPNSAPLSFDRSGNKLNAYPLPIKLDSDEIWLLSDVINGFDSRYLGPAKLHDCVKVIPLITF